MHTQPSGTTLIDWAKVLISHRASTRLLVRFKRTLRPPTKKAAKGAAQANESYDQLRGDVVDLHSRGAAHAKGLGDVASMLGSE